MGVKDQAKTYNFFRFKKSRQDKIKSKPKTIQIAAISKRTPSANACKMVEDLTSLKSMRYAYFKKKAILYTVKSGTPIKNRIPKNLKL